MEHVITILDAYTTTHGSISWDGLESLGRVVAYDRTSPSDVVARCIDSDIVLTNKVVIDSSIMSQLPKLAYIGVLATGY
ncbi:MAG: D-2-hydroxyacid dehydrogenase, partial [Bacteroidales bacterium]|nr:D-2-hydroxyacid dehydrogenase [Bacteroidales bacterium]